tara:strand:- start:14228 stop:14401 length:174 start_codon:yes stop_codon:yes gene_type:complete
MNYRAVSQMALDHITKYRNEIGKKFTPYYDVDFVGSTMLNTRENRKLNKLAIQKVIL